MMLSDWKRSKSISNGEGEVEGEGEGESEGEGEGEGESEGEGEGEVEVEVECVTRRNLKGGGKLFFIVKMCTSDLKSVPVIATMQTITERPRKLAIDCNSTFHLCDPLSSSVLLHGAISACTKDHVLYDHSTCHTALLQHAHDRHTTRSQEIAKAR